MRIVLVVTQSVQLQEGRSRAIVTERMKEFSDRLVLPTCKRGRLVEPHVWVQIRQHVGRRQPALHHRASPVDRSLPHDRHQP